MDIKKIAEGLGCFERITQCKHHLSVMTKEGVLGSFDPLNNWNDTGLVLEALIKIEPSIAITDQSYKQTKEISIAEIYCGGEEIIGIAQGKNLQEAICKAYLATQTD